MSRDIDLAPTEYRRTDDTDEAIGDWRIAAEYQKPDRWNFAAEGWGWWFQVIAMGAIFGVMAWLKTRG